VKLALVAALVGCSSSSDITGPFTGEVRRYYVDSFSIPMDATEAIAIAADLDGDDNPENVFGNVTGVLNSTGDLSVHGADMIASRALYSVVDIQADDLADDDAAGVTYYGANFDATGEPAVVFGGRFVGGAFTSNRTADTAAPGMATVHLPIYTNADPLILPLEVAEIELRPDGSGGFDALVRGGFREELARQAAFEGLVQMFETEPGRHLVFHRGVDKDRDGTMSRSEVDDSVIALLVTADVDLFAGDPNPDSISVAFGVHLTPLQASLTPANHCRDRTRDADETDVDCGGSCQACWHGKSCTRAEDCQSRACDGGTCRAPTCTDGVKDGYESDVDCGAQCAPCASGRTCAADTDCTSNACSNGIASLGTCS
jgi:hypothetical protein